MLVTGESGTGKELVARALHDLSSRRSKPFVAVNCAAIPETLIESEIFGHEKGAFTGAMERRAGCFELAEEGTLLLDEIGEMPVATQAKLLRVLEDRKLRRLGSKAETPVDVRVVAATNKDPQQAVAERPAARRSLLSPQRLQHPDAARCASMPADIPAIAAEDDRGHERAARLHDVRDRRPTLLERLLAYDWPGNVRELRNTIERATILAGNGTDRMSSICRRTSASRAMRPSARPSAEPARCGQRRVDVAEQQRSDERTVRVEVGTTVDEAERQLILKTLQSTHNNKTGPRRFSASAPRPCRTS